MQIDVRDVSHPEETPICHTHTHSRAPQPPRTGVQLLNRRRPVVEVPSSRGSSKRQKAGGFGIDLNCRLYKGAQQGQDLGLTVCALFFFGIRMLGRFTLTGTLTELQKVAMAI